MEFLFLLLPVPVLKEVMNQLWSIEKNASELAGINFVPIIVRNLTGNEVSLSWMRATFSAKTFCQLREPKHINRD